MRVKTGTVRHRKHHKILKLAKGYRMSRSKLFKKAKEAVLHADQYSYHGRKLKKRNFRTLWIQRIKASLSTTDLSYSKFIKKLSDHQIKLNRKILSELATNHSKTFFTIVDKLK